jgi:hypothetical protein
MKTKDIILLASGLVLGYFISKMNWGKKTSIGVGQVLNGVGETATGVVKTTTGIVSDVKEVAKDTSGTIECEKRWQEKVGNVSRFLSSEAKSKSKSDYVKNCMDLK